MSTELAAKLGRVLIVGGGSMGRAICAGLLRIKGFQKEALVIANPGKEKRTALEADFGIATVAQAVDALPADTIILAVKPAKVAGVATELAAAGIGDALVVSIAAGVSTEALAAAFGHETPIVRVMPNTPLAVGVGASGVSGSVSTPAHATALVAELFCAMGSAVVVDESLQDAVTAVSGSGPAYFELVVEAMARAGAELGLGYDTALELALSTMYGTAVMLRQTGQPLPEAIEAVSSPGGTTVAALSAFREGGLPEAIQSGVRAAWARSKELGA